MAKLNADQILVAQAWLHDIFVAGGVLPNPKRAVDIANYGNMYGEHRWNRGRRAEICNKAKILCDAIKNRKVDTQLFKDYDQLLEYFSGQYFWKYLSSKTDADSTKKNPSMLARYISWFCSTYPEFVWYDGDASVYEREEIQKTTLGAALFADKCFESQRTATPKATTTTTTTTPKATTTTKVAGQPQNNFKSRGPLSNVAVDLIGAPNQKINLTGPLYCVNGNDGNHVVEDTLYIRPVEADPNSQAKYTTNGTNKILFGKAKGYGYCQVYFETAQEAQDAAEKAVINRINKNPAIQGFTVCQLGKTLSNGYFKIGTEYGPVYISASKLNEGLTEEADQDQPTTLTNKEKWERYEEAFFHEM